MPLPTFLLIGAPRAATTSLHHWLGQHPDVCVSRPKETQFFSLHYAEGAHYYDRFFAHHGGEPVVGESTPVYLTLPHVPRRIAEALPGVALLAVLRDPVEQAYSSWWKLRCLGVERRSFDDAVADELAAPALDESAAERYWFELWEATARGRPADIGRYLAPGRYVEAIDRYLEHVDRSQLTLLLHDDLVRRPEQVVRRVAAAVDVDPGGAARPVPPRANQSVGRGEAWARRRLGWVPSARVRNGVAAVVGRFDRPPPGPAPSTRRDLTAYFAGANEGLAERLGVTALPWWTTPVGAP